MSAWFCVPEHALSAMFDFGVCEGLLIGAAIVLIVIAVTRFIR